MSIESAADSHAAVAAPRWKWLKVVTVTVLVGGLGTLLIRLLSDREPVHQGIRFSRLIELRQPEVTVRAAYQIGPEIALPYLIEALTKEDSALDRFNLQIWKRLPARLKNRHVDRMPVPADSTRVKALTVLSQMGPDAKSALPEVIRITTAHLTNDRSHLLHTALAALGEIGSASPEAVPPLVAALRSTNGSVHLVAAISLFNFGKLAAPAVPIATQAFRERDVTRVSAAYYILSGVGPDAAEALPVLMKALDDDALALSAASILRGFGPVAAPAVPGLTRWIEKHQTNCTHAVEALMNIGPGAKTAVPVLISLSSDTNPMVRILAAMALARIEEQPGLALPVLVEHMGRPARGRSQSPWGPPFNEPRRFSIGFSPQVTAAWFLGELGPAAVSAAPALLVAVTNRQPWLSTVAARSLWKVDGNPRQALPALIQSLDSKDNFDRMLAARFLAEMGAEAAPALPRLRELRNEDLRWPVRRVVVEAVKRIDSAVAPGVTDGSTLLAKPD